MENFITELFELRSLLVPVRICHTARRRLGQTTRTHRTLRVFGVRVAQWDTTSSGVEL